MNNNKRPSEPLEAERRAETEREIRYLKRSTSLLSFGILVHGILIAGIILRIS